LGIQPFTHLGRRLFFKIALVFSLSLIAIIIIFPLTIRFILLPERFPIFMRSGADHAIYLVNDIGIPPNIEKARQLQQRLGIQIRIAGTGMDWAGVPGMVDFKDIQLAPIRGINKVFAGFTPFGFCVICEKGSYRFLLVLFPREENIFDQGRIFLLVLAFYVALVIFIMFFIIRWLLRDVKVLDEGMKQIGSGNLAHRMNSRRRDELGQLVNSFNTMSEKIQEMIRNRERLLLDVSHELRSPLTRIKVALELQEDNDSIASIRNDIVELETMISELLESERLNSPHGGLKKSRVPLAEAIPAICRAFKDRLPGISIQPFPESLNLELDPERFKIMLRNVLDNALRFSELNSLPIAIGVLSFPDEIVISVEDHGKGIPEQDIPHIFEPFYRVDKSRSKETGGYGLGMNLVQKIMTAHGGRIEVSSRLNQGTTITLHFKS
jgi:signal transduction histidine kinase